MNNQRTMTVVFLAGMGTHLSRRDASAAPGGQLQDFWDEEKLVPHFRRSGLSAQYLVYSYRGIDPQNSLGFEPAPYSARDTLNRHILIYAERLHYQLITYAERHPSTDFHLVGHSEGGMIAFAYLALSVRNDCWRFPNGGRLASVATLDAPLGGVAATSRLQVGAVRVYFALIHRWPAFTSINDLLQIYRTTSHRYPLGGRGKVMELINSDHRQAPVSNQDLAVLAHRRGIRVLTIGNVRDHCFAPGHGVESFVSTQWLSDTGHGSGIHGRWVVLGKRRQSLGDIALNHGAVLSDPSVHEGILSFILGGDPDPLLPAPHAESLAHWLKLENNSHAVNPTSVQGMNT